MPELPEVETVVRDLRGPLTGRRVVSVKAGPLKLRRTWSVEWEPLLLGRTIRRVERRGKWVRIGLDDDSLLAVHLGMTGQLTVVPAAVPPADHTHLVIGLDRGRELRFRDIRRFGCALRFASPAAFDEFLAGQLGPEPFDLSTKVWRDRLAGTTRCLKAVLLDQRVLAGVGNIYADEALFQARLHPTRPGCDLTAAEADRLRRAVATVLRRAIDRRGSTIRNYVGGSGLKGEYQDEFRVYGRTGQPCRRCRAAVERIRLAGRSTHYCPRCQPV